MMHFSALCPDVPDSVQVTHGMPCPGSARAQPRTRLGGPSGGPCPQQRARSPVEGLSLPAFSAAATSKAGLGGLWAGDGGRGRTGLRGGTYFPSGSPQPGRPWRKLQMQESKKDASIWFP